MNLSKYYSWRWNNLPISISSGTLSSNTGFFIDWSSSQYFKGYLRITIVTRNIGNTNTVIISNPITTSNIQIISAATGYNGGNKNWSIHDAVIYINHSISNQTYLFYSGNQSHNLQVQTYINIETTILNNFGTQYDDLIDSSNNNIVQSNDLI